ncbi:uncharacterized protein LOC103580019 [Microplitis demolitor]|uniref:uncharacterized protein LOC103580019 n=1 Tax=Microplitis demolitor TaxID=69319 RepID=UPI0004CD8D4D|nr:uncharacterized protein LOC103580019 [Microplitis demolitor]
MFQKPVKTYGKKTQPVTSSFGPELMKLYTKRTFVPITPDSSIDFDEYLNKSANDSNDRNPFESTFDRVVKSAKLPATVDPNLQLVDSTTDSSEEPLELIPIDGEVSRSNSDDFRNETAAETEATKHGTDKKTSDVNKSQPTIQSLVDSESIESIGINDHEAQNSSIDSDDNLHKPAGNQSSDQSPLEYSSESTKLPATSPHDLNPQFVDTTTDSNEESFEFIPIDNPEVQININDKRKYKASNLVDNKKEDKTAKSSQAKTRVRKRQIKNIGKDSSDSDASAKSSPVRKTRRAVNKIYNRVSRDRAGSLEDKNQIVCKKVTGVNELKDCCVKLTRLELKENRFNNNNVDEFNSVHSDDCRGDDANDVEGDGDVDSDMKTKECRVRLSRLNNNSKLGLQADLMQTFLSSTPCDHRVGFKKLKPTVSPIQLPGSDKKNLTVPPTILLNDSNELFEDEDGRSPARKSSKKLSESSESVVEDTFNEQKKPAGKVKLRLDTEEEASIKSVDLFSSYSDELSNKSGENDPSVVNSTDDNVFESKEFNEDNGTTRSSSRTLIDPTLSVGQTSAEDPDEESVEINQNSVIDSSQSYEMDQRSSIDDSVLLEIDEGNMVDNSQSFGISRRMSSADTNSEVDQNKNSQLIQMDKKNLTADSEASEIIQDKFIEDSKLVEMDERSSIAYSEPSEISQDKFTGNSKLLEMDQRSSIAYSEPSGISQDKFIEDSKSFKIDQPSSLIDENLINQSTSVNNTSSVIIINENSSLIENRMSITENTADKNDLNDSSETDDDYHLVVSNTSSNKEDDNSPEVSSQEDDDKKDEEQTECSESKNVSIIKPSEPIVLLERINSLGHITKRRREYQSWARDLGDIAESSGLGLSHVAEETEKIPEHVNQRISRRRNVRSTKTTLPVRRSSRIKSDPSELDDRPKKSRVGFLEPVSDPFDEDDKNDDAKVLYLKPGKSWARSLSILNNIRKEEDLDSMSTGNKGKKWRQSVRNVLSMQRQSVVQSCVKDQENDKSERQTFNDKLLVSKRSNAPKVSIVNNNEVESGAGRFVRRMSIRVVPNSNKYSIVNDKIIKDSSFLKVFGISTDKNDEVKKKSLAAKDSLVYQLRCSSTPALDVLPEPVSARNVVLQRCDQTDSLPFEACYPDSYLKYCRKIGEGVYGEVFLYDDKKDKSVIKIIPIEGSELVNGEPQKKYGEILSEIIIAKELHNLRFNKIYQTNGFVEVKNIRCIVGRYPYKLLELWDTYDEEKNSENDSPSMFTDDQIYIALELGNGGQDMEAFVFNNSAEAYITFLQAALALAVAEKSLDFEHRDMHWGNILISRTNEKQVSCRLGNEEISLQCNGIKTTIIDFTLSRMSYQGCCMFNDLSLDPALFTAVGEYQFDIYRLMKEKTENNWQSFVPYTNILWLHYTLDKMVTAVRYKNVTSKIHKQSIQKLEELKSSILEYESAFDFISNCDKLTSLRRSIC